MMKNFLFTILLLLFSMTFMQAQTAYITNATDGTVSVVNMASGEVVTTIQVGGLPFGVSVSPDESKIYVSDITGNRVAIIDAATYIVTDYVAVGSSPFGLDVSPDGTKVFVADFNANQVSVINTTTLEVTNLPAGSRPYGVISSPLGNAFAATDYSSNKITITDVTNGTIFNEINVGLAPTGITITDDNSFIYVANYQTDNITAINANNINDIQTISAGDAPFGIVVNADNTKLYVSNQHSNDVSIIDVATGNTDISIPVGDAPFGIDLSPDGTQVWVACSGSNKLYVIDVATNMVTNTIDVGNSPRSFGKFASSRVSASVGAALNFDGSNDYVALPDELRTMASGALSVEAWFNADNIVAGQSIVHNLEWTSNGNLFSGYAISMLGQTGIEGIIVTDDNGLIRLQHSGISTNQWYHVAMTYDGTVAKLYIDGEEVATKNATGAIDYVPLPVGFNIGRYEDTNENFYFDGDIDEVRLWNRALSCFEVEQQRNCELSGTENGLFAYYQFNQGVADNNNSAITELTATTGPNGTLTNFTLMGETSNFVSLGGVISDNECSGEIMLAEFTLRGNDLEIADGDDTPSSTDGTDLGDLALNETRSFDFAVGFDVNTTIGQVMSSNPAFTATYMPGTPQSIVRVSYAATTLGTQNTTITVPHNDCSANNIFTFDVQATGDESGAALNFDGNNDYVSLPDELRTMAIGSVSVEAWFNADNIASGQSIVHNLEWTSNGNLFSGYAISMNGQNGIEGLVVTNDNGLVRIQHSGINTGQWYHVAMTYDGTVAKLYIDGEEVAAENATGAIDYIPLPVGFNIGRYIDSNENIYFDGSIDEVRIWNRALTCFEVEQQRNCELNGGEDGLIAYYTMDQGLAGVDNSGITELIATTGPNGTLNNFALMGDMSNFIAPGGVANGVICNPVNAATLVSVDGNNIIIPNGDDTPIAIDGTDFGTILVGQNTSQSFHIIADGQLGFSGVTTNNSAFVIGNTNLQTGMFPISFSPTAAGEQTAVITVHVSDCTINDMYTFTITAKAIFEPGASLNFDGINDHVTLPNDLRTVVTENLTVEAWFRSNSFDGDESIVHNAEWTNSQGQQQYAGYALMTRNNGRIAAFIATGDNQFSVLEYGGLVIDQWYHAALTFDGSMVKLYLDGEVVATAEASGVIDYNPVPQGFYIGRYHDVNESYYFDGDIDEVRIWNRTLSCTEIEEHLNCEINGDEADLLAYYQFNQGNAGEDNTGITELVATTGPNGTLHNFALMGETSNFIAAGGVSSGMQCGTFELPEFAVVNVATDVEIVDGEDMPSVSNGTDFGDEEVGATTNVDFVYEISGDATINPGESFITTGGDFGFFFGDNNIIQVNFSPTAAGVQTATLSIAYIDCSGTRFFTFVVQGNGVALDGDDCSEANEINTLFGQPFNEPQVSTQWDNTGYSTAASDPENPECYFENDPLASTVWYTFTGDGNKYSIRSIQCGDSPDNLDMQVAIYAGDCDNPIFVACNEDEDGPNGVLNFDVELVTEAGVNYLVMVDGYADVTGAFCLEVTNLTVVGVTNLTETGFNVYPNPTSGIVQLPALPMTRVEVYDAVGQLVLSQLKPSNTIDLNKYPTGIYLIKLHTDEAVYATKVVKE